MKENITEEFKLVALSTMIILLFPFCISERNANLPDQKVLSATEAIDQNTKGEQIGKYVVASFEDSKGNLWFGTMSKGVAKYDGTKLTYFTTNDGLIGNAVTNIAEDKEGNIWLGTHSGLSKYDTSKSMDSGEGVFTNFTVKDGLCDERVSNLLIDSKGNFWVGTWGGVCMFDPLVDPAAGKAFTSFPVPVPDIQTRLNEDTKNWVTEIMEDSKGNIWIGRDSYGACMYDGQNFTHITKKDGIPSNYVHGIVEDKEGNMWFGTRVAEKDDPDPSKRFGDGGLTKFDGQQFIQFPNIAGLSKNDVYSIYCDDEGVVWISTTGEGVYMYDPARSKKGEHEFTNFKVKSAEDESTKAVQNILKDRKGNIWFGCSGGLYKLNSNGVVNVTKEGPWY